MMALSAYTSLADEVVAAVRSVVGPGPVPLHAPHFAGNEWRYVQECLDSSYVSSIGPFVTRFEAELAAYTGAKHAVATVTGTAALHLALHLAGVQRGDEVLVPALTFVATANAVTYCGAVPHFTDSSEHTLGVDPDALRDYLATITELHSGHCVNRLTGNIIRAVVPMHAFGHPAEIEAIVELAREFRLVVVEDAAESLGSRVNGRHTGTFGAMGSLSFNGNKTITTGGGGAIITNDAELAARARHLSTTAKLPHRWEYRHDETGFNYRLPNLNAALGCAQLERLDALLAAKRCLYMRYRAAFCSSPAMHIMREPAGCQSNYWLQTLVLGRAFAAERDAILEATNEAGFMTRPAWVPMNRLPHFQACPRMDLPVAESLEARLVNLPSSPQLLAQSPRDIA